MRLFKDAYEMVREVERDLWEMGISVHPDTMQDKHVADDDDYMTKEIQAYDYTLTNPRRDKLLAAIEYMGGNLSWCMSEEQDRIKDEYINPGESWSLFKECWTPFLRDGKFAYTYNERFREQLPFLINELIKRPNTRQAIITMYDRHQDIGNWGGRDRIPCSMYYQFYIRNGQLHLIYTMRSCDFLTHFIHDVYFALSLQKYVSEQIEVPVGHFVHFIGSLHAYNKDMKTRGIF
jgi:thymidylate synthase